MLYSPQQFNKDQLLADLLAVRERLAQPEAWHKGGFYEGDSVCMVAAVNSVAGQELSTQTIAAGESDQDKLRVGRMLVAIYMALYGAKASRDLTITQVAGRIINFNDGAASHAAVLLLLDRAVAALLTPAEQAPVAGVAA